MSSQNVLFVVVTSFSDPRTRIFMKSQIWLVMLFFCLILPFPMTTNEKQKKMTPDSEPGSQLESSFLILVQGFSSKVRYDWSCRFLSYFIFSNENPWKTKKNDARHRARQPAWQLISDSRPKIFMKRQIWVVMPFFVLFYILKCKPTKNKEKWRQAASQAASLSWPVLWSPQRRPPKWRNRVRNWWEPIANWGGLIFDVSDWFWAGGFLACPMVSPTQAPQMKKSSKELVRTDSTLGRPNFLEVSDWFWDGGILAMPYNNMY